MEFQNSHETQPMKVEPTVFIVDDDAAIRRSLILLTRSVQLAAEAYETADQYLSAVSGDRPGCLLLDVRIPAMSGLELQRRLVERKSAIPIIFLTGYGDVPTAVQSLKAGAFDFVEKPFQNHQLLDTIQAALRQNQQLRSRFVRRSEIEARLEMLTPGERSVLDQMTAGDSYKKIAKDLNISYKTVQARRGQIMRKMNAIDFPGLMRMLVDAQLTVPA